MREISNKKYEEKKRKKNQIILGIILIGVMILSTFGIVVDSFGKNNSKKNLVYNQYEFVKQGDYWYSQINEKTFVFKYNPYEIQESFNITGDGLKSINNYQGNPLYIYSEDYQAEREIVLNLNGIPLRIQRACLNDSNFENTKKELCPEELPIKDCSNNFIIIKESEKKEIYQKEGCAFILGEKENLLKLTDEYLFKILGLKE